MITNYTNNNKCSNFGKCCIAILPMNQQEINRIKHYVKKHGIKEQRHNAMMKYDLTCPFRDEANKFCMIYDVRPEICRKFICNQSMEKVYLNRQMIYKGRSDVFMRSEFYQNDEDKKGFEELKRSIF